MSYNYGSIDTIDQKRNLTNLIQRITTNLQSIRQITQSLNEMYTILGGPRDSPSKQEEIHKLNVKANQLIVLTQSLLESIPQVNIVDQDSRVQVNRVQEEKKAVIGRYMEAQEKIMTKMGQILREQRKVVQMMHSSVTEDLSQSQSQLVENDEELRSTEEAEQRMHMMEKAVVDLQKMFEDINELVVADRQQVEHIEDNVQQASTDVDQANVQLGEAIVYKRKALKKKICIIVTVLVILAIIGLIIGLSLKKK